MIKVNLTVPLAYTATGAKPLTQPDSIVQWSSDPTRPGSVGLLRILPPLAFVESDIHRDVRPNRRC